MPSLRSQFQATLRSFATKAHKSHKEKSDKRWAPRFTNNSKEVCGLFNQKNILCLLCLFVAKFSLFLLWLTLMSGSHGREALVDLLRRHVFLVRRNGPNVTKGIGQCSGTIAIELVLQRLHFRATCIDRLLENRVAIVNINHQAHRSSAISLRALKAHLG